MGWRPVQNVDLCNVDMATDPFPKERQGCLDRNLLKKLGMSKERIQKKDCLFFLQLILPMCDTTKSGVRNDPRKLYYSDVEKFTNIYAA